MKAGFRWCADADAAYIARELRRVPESYPDGIGALTEKGIQAAISHPGMRFVVLMVDGLAIGFELVEVRPQEAEVHTVISEEFRGRPAFCVAKAFHGWLFSEMPGIARIVSQVPKTNKAAAMFARYSGMRLVSRDGTNFTKSGVTAPMDVYQIERIELCQQQQS